MKNSKYFISIHMSKNTNIYTSCWVYIQIHSFKKYAKINTTWKKSFFQKVLYKHASRPFHWLTTYFGKKKEKKKKISLKLKNIIYIQHNDKNIHHHWFLKKKKKKKKNTYKTILLEACAIKQRKIKLKFKENQKITWKLERKSLNWERVSPRRLWIKRDWNLREKI